MAQSKINLPNQIKMFVPTNISQVAMDIILLLFKLYTVYWFFRIRSSSFDCHSLSCSFLHFYFRYNLKLIFLKFKYPRMLLIILGITMSVDYLIRLVFTYHPGYYDQYQIIICNRLDLASDIFQFRFGKSKFRETEVNYSLVIHGVTRSSN